MPKFAPPASKARRVWAWCRGVFRRLEKRKQSRLDAALANSLSCWLLGASKALEKLNEYERPTRRSPPPPRPPKPPPTSVLE